MSTLQNLMARSGRRSARGDDYAGVDIKQAQRVGALLGVVGILVAVPLMLVVPPTERVGAIGYAVAAAVLVSAAIASARARSNLSFEVGLGMAYLAVGQALLLEWLAGGWQSPYHQLYILPVVYVAGVHPARRVVTFVGVLAVAGALPLLYDGVSARALGTVTARWVFVAGLALVLYQLMRRVRAQHLDLSRRGEEARRLARVDPLTGLGNRRAFNEALEREAARSERNRVPLTLVVVDLDGFKEINDRFGHIKGDECLRDVAGVIDAEVRRPDACFRWGGDEFALVLPDTDSQGAELVVRRLSVVVEGTCRAPDGSAITVTCGVAGLSRETMLDDLVAAADADLMRRKAMPTEARLT